MRCEDVQAHVADYLAGTLSAAVMDAIAGHLSTCRLCAAEFDELRDTWQMLEALPTEPADASAMRARFTEMLGAHTTPQPAGSASPPSRAGWTPARRAICGAAAAAVLLIGLAAGRASTDKTQTNPQITVLREELREMRRLVTLSLLQQQSVNERLKGVTWTTQLDRRSRDLLSSSRPDDELTRMLLDALMRDQQGGTASRPTLRGVWRVTQVTFTGPNARTIAAQAGLFIFTERHFGTMQANSDTPRPNLPPADKTTDEDVAAALRAFTAFAGTYEIVGDELRTNSAVELSPNNTRSEGFPRTFTYKADGKTLQLIQKTINNAPVANPLTLRYERVED